MPNRPRPWRVHFRWSNGISGCSAYYTKAEADAEAADMHKRARARQADSGTPESAPRHVITEVIHREVDITPKQRQAAWTLATKGQIFHPRNKRGIPREASFATLEALVARGYGRWVRPERGETPPYVLYMPHTSPFKHS